MSSEQKFVDNDPSIYSSHVLYVIGTNSNCVTVLRHLERRELGEHMFVYDIATTKPPAWLTGVPTLFCRRDNKYITGVRNICSYADQWKNTELLHNPTSINAGWSSSLTMNAMDASAFTLEE